jgi:hypothetical protein
MPGLATHPNTPNKETSSGKEQRKRYLLQSMDTPQEEAKKALQPIFGI